MDTFFVARLPKWSLVLFGNNPLVRISDWVEALVVVSTVLVSLLAVPIACAVGTAVHDSTSTSTPSRLRLATPLPRRSPTTEPPAKTRQRT